MKLSLYLTRGHVIVKYNLLIFKLIGGYGYLFLIMPFDMGLCWVVSKWFIAPKALESYAPFI